MKTFMLFVGYAGIGFWIGVLLRRAKEILDERSEDPCYRFGIHTDPVDGRCQSCGKRVR